MSDTKISNYTELTAVAPDDELVIVDKSDTTMAASGTTKKITKDNLVPQINPASADAPASIDLAEDTDNGTNKITITAPSAVASDKVLTLPDATDTLVGKATTDTLTNKTLTTPIIKSWDGWQPVSDSWSYASADAPTFTITVPSGAGSLYSAGMKIRLTQTTVKYFIVTAVADTVLTVYGGTEYTLVDTAISDISYSTQKAPLGFPLDPVKWTVEVTDTTIRTQNTPTANTWYNLGSISISIPIGCWNLYYSVNIDCFDSNGQSIEAKATLSTANNSESDSDFTIREGLYLQTGSYGPNMFNTMSRQKFLNIASKTTYYINSLTTNASADRIQNSNDSNKLIIRASCTYL